ncbi:MAG: hypothetical protein NTV86_21875 [Planctomycetota bacterium]|nr:hypothetical protein [Planctomycetota bacterium]
MCGKTVPIDLACVPEEYRPLAEGVDVRAFLVPEGEVRALCAPVFGPAARAAAPAPDSPVYLVYRTMNRRDEGSHLISMDMALVCLPRSFRVFVVSSGDVMGGTEAGHTYSNYFIVRLPLAWRWRDVEGKQFKLVPFQGNVAPKMGWFKEEASGAPGGPEALQEYQKGQ